MQRNESVLVSVSVVTVVKDDSAGLSTTCESLLEQVYADWDQIIVAAESQDDTFHVAKGFQEIDSRIHAFQQEGIGIYEAMNEGIEKSTGEFIWFMNAGDKFVDPSVLAHAVEEMRRTNVGLLVGGYQIINGSSNPAFRAREGNITMQNFAFTRRGGCHQAMIFNSKILKDIGGFDTAYSLASDFDLVLRIIKKAGANRVSKIYAGIQPGGRADQGIFLVHRQKHQIRQKLLGGPIIFVASFLWTVLARAKIILRRVLSMGM
jgi:cellulose synthase/poly-beta-1,6-N-acetylglucosamine synthase-like glycosyltransferase